MTSLQIHEGDFPSLLGKVAIVTGGASGIGLATSRILSSLGAMVHILDLNPPPPSEIPERAQFNRCNVASWPEIRAAFKRAGHVDIAIANAGVSEETDYFLDTFDDDGNLLEPPFRVIDVNFRAVINFVKLSISAFRRQGSQGSIVVTASATAYAPEQSLPVYSASKLGLIGLMRALRSTLPSSLNNTTINVVAPAATITALLPADLAAPIQAAGLPVSSAYHVALAIVYSITASQRGQVELYGNDEEGALEREGRWNGRCIMTLGDGWTEMEGPIAGLRCEWMGRENRRLTRLQQQATDFRGVKGTDDVANSDGRKEKGVVGDGVNGQ